MTAGWRAGVSWLLPLVALMVGGTSGSEDVLWPAGVTDMELWEMMDQLEPAISGNSLRISELGVRMVDMGEKSFANPKHYSKRNGFTECESGT